MSVDRFWAKVSRGDGCWEWRGQLDAYGYGSFHVGTVDGKPVRAKAHRYAWGLEHGQIPPGMSVCHRCDNRRCVRPDHLFIGTNADNLRDMVEKGRSCSGERHWGATLTAADVAQLRAAYAAGGITQRELAARYKLSREEVGRIVRGQAWRHATGPRGALGPPRGERHRSAKLRESDVARIRERYAAGVQSPELAADYGVSSGTVTAICRGDVWKSAPGPITRRRSA